LTRASSVVRRSPPVAAALSFLWPGLGQLYAGRTRAALLFAAPVFGAVLVLLVTAASGIEQLAVLLITPSNALTVLVLMNRLAIAMGGHVRVGLEDNLWWDDERTELATNPRLVERLVVIARSMGREPAGPDKVRERLGIPSAC
jgi:TM2 domain-containing membrane protein YozV